MTTKWDGSDQEFWDAVAIANDPDADETECIAAAVVLQEVLTLAQDMLTRPEELPEIPRAAAVPQKIIERPKPGDIVDVERAVELFGDNWILRPVSPSKESAMSPVRDYRVRNGQLEFNSSYPPRWQESAGVIADCAQWQVICQQEPEVFQHLTPSGVLENAPTRVSRTTVRTGT